MNVEGRRLIKVIHDTGTPSIWGHTEHFLLHFSGFAGQLRASVWITWTHRDTWDKSFLNYFLETKRYEFGKTLSHAYSRKIFARKRLRNKRTRHHNLWMFLGVGINQSRTSSKCVRVSYLWKHAGSSNSVTILAECWILSNPLATIKFLIVSSNGG